MKVSNFSTSLSRKGESSFGSFDLGMEERMVSVNNEHHRCPISSSQDQDRARGKLERQLGRYDHRSSGSYPTLKKKKSSIVGKSVNIWKSDGSGGNPVGLFSFLLVASSY